MIVTFVHVWVKEPYVDDFIKATIENHEHTVLEPGNLRFDFLRDANNPNKFVLYEVFKSEEAITAHKETKHYLNWKDAVAGWMEQPRQGIKHQVIRPLEETSW
jgi:autoinducer 2-degrading protein